MREQSMDEQAQQAGLVHLLQDYFSQRERVEAQQLALERELGGETTAGMLAQVREELTSLSEDLLAGVGELQEDFMGLSAELEGIEDLLMLHKQVLQESTMLLLEQFSEGKERGQALRARQIARQERVGERLVAELGRSDQQRERLGAAAGMATEFAGALAGGMEAAQEESARVRESWAGQVQEHHARTEQMAENNLSSRLSEQAGLSQVLSGLGISALSRGDMLMAELSDALNREVRELTREGVEELSEAIARATAMLGQDQQELLMIRSVIGPLIQEISDLIHPLRAHSERIHHRAYELGVQA